MWISKVFCKLLESYFGWLIGKGPYPGGFLYGNREWIKIVFRWNHEARDLISSGLTVSCDFYKQLSRSLPWRLIRTGCEKISQECKQQLKASSRYIKHLHPVNAFVTHKLQAENAVQGEWQGIYLSLFHPIKQNKIYLSYTKTAMSHAAKDSLDENSPGAPPSGISLITSVFFALYTQRFAIIRLMSNNKLRKK